MDANIPAPTFIASDGYPFWLQVDGTLTDTFNPDNADIIWGNVKEVFDAIKNDILTLMTIDTNPAFAEYEQRMIAMQTEIETDHKFTYNFCSVTGKPII